MNLYQLSEAWKQIEGMLYEENIDEQCILDTLESIEGEIEDKADGYAKIIKGLTRAFNSKKEEAKELMAKASREEARAKFLRNKLEEMMRLTGKTKFKTDLFSFNIQANGGLAPLWVDEDISKIPDEYLKKEPDNKKIRDLLKNQNVEWARLEERGESLVIR